MERLALQEHKTLGFGQGPVLPEEPSRNIVMGETPATKGALNWWGKELIQSGIILARDRARRLKVMGGNTGPEGTLSEAEEKLDERAKERGLDLGYYAQRDDPELKTIVRKQEEEDLWTRALLTIPDYSLPYFARIKNDERLMAILRNFDTNFFPSTDTEPSALEAHGINIETDSPDEIREKLSEIKRDLPDEDKREAWIAEQKTGIGWPIAVEEKLQNILYPPKLQFISNAS